MPKPSRTRNSAIRASFGRAERLQREAGDGRPTKAARLHEQLAADRAARKRERGRAGQARAGSAGISRPQGQARKLTALETVAKRVERARDTSERQRQQRLKEQMRVAFNRDAERRRDTTRRVEQDRQRQAIQATLKRHEDTRRRHAQKATERKREDMRRAFNREADRRRDATRRLEHDRLRQRATVEIEQRHKRQLGDQQAEHRRQTSEVRTRHQAETRSMRGKESAALERHRHAIRGIDDREARVLDDFVGRRGGLVGRLVERIPGRREAKDRQQADIQRGFEAERLAKHRDLEALKERQSKLAQDTRINQARERKASMESHRTERTQLADRQTADRPRLIEGQVRALVRAERERGREAEQARKEPEREIARPTAAFSRAR